MPDGICPFAIQLDGVEDYTEGEVDRVGFCDHAAGGFWTTLDNAAFWNTQGVSVHFGIARDGRICQITNLFDSPWAEGRLGPHVTWPQYPTMNYRNPNGYLVSTEHEDYEIVNGIARAVVGSQWTAQEYQSDLQVKQWCIEEVKRVLGKDLLVFGIDSLTGHHMFDSVNRAECPGLYWRNEYRQRLYRDLKGEEVFIRHNAISQWYARPENQIMKPNSTAGINATVDFQIPDGVLDIEVEVYVNEDSANIQVLDGDESNPGQQAFQVERPLMMYSGRVKLTPFPSGAWFHIASDKGHIRAIGCVGYYK